MVIRILLLVMIIQVNERIHKREQNSRNILARKIYIYWMVSFLKSLSKHSYEFGHWSIIGCYFLSLSSVGTTPMIS